MGRTILQAGVAKSGNFWLYQILSRILDYASIEVKSVIKEQEEYEELAKLDLSFKGQVDIDTIEISEDRVHLVVSKVFRKRLDYRALSQENYLFWTHSIYNDGWHSFLKNNDKVVYVIRDPRDVFLSKINFAFGSYSKQFIGDRGDMASFRKYRLYSSTYAWIENVLRILEGISSGENRIVFVFYEDLLRDLEGNISTLAMELGCCLSPEDVAIISDDVSAGRLRRASSGHVSKEIAVGKWRSKLNRREHSWFRYVFGTSMDFISNPKSGLYLKENMVNVIKDLKRARRRVVLSPIFYLSLVFDGRGAKELLSKANTYIFKYNGRTN